MALTDFTPITDEVKVSDGVSFAVRGLSFDDISTLVQSHYDPLSRLFDEYIAEGIAAAVIETENDELSQVVLGVMKQAPGLIADVIALAADERDEVDRIKRLTIGVQIDAIQKTLVLTLQAEGGLGKLVETITGLVQGLKAISTEDRPA